MRQVFAFINHKTLQVRFNPVRFTVHKLTLNGDTLLDETWFHALKIAQVFYTV